MIDSNETVKLVCKTATVNEKSGDHKSALFKLVLYNKKLHPKGDKGEKSSFIGKLFCLLILLNISKDWTKSERERREARLQNYSGEDQHIDHCLSAKLKLEWKSQLRLQGHKTLPVGSRGGGVQGVGGSLSEEENRKCC